MERSSPSVRRIDDCLDQIYRAYKELQCICPDNNGADGVAPTPIRAGAGSHGRKNPKGCHLHARIASQCSYYFPMPLLALCVANSSDATEILMLSYLLADSSFRRVMFLENANGDSPHTNMVGAEYLASSIFMGMLLGGALLGFLSDHIGRRPALLAGLCINATAGFVSSLPFLTPTIAQLTVWRFISGLGVGATVPSLFSLVSEWSPKEVRGAVVTLVASFWMVGSLFVSGLGWVLLSRRAENDMHQILPPWRLFSALCAFPSAMGMYMVYIYVPESPRFLASSRKDYEQAAHVCNSMASSLGLKPGASQLSLADSFLLEAHGTGTIGMHVSLENATKVSREQPRQAFSYNRLRAPLETFEKIFSRKLLTHTTLPLLMIWLSLSFSTYGITTWINTLFVEIHLQNMYFNSFLFALANGPGNFFSVMYSDKWGRKRMLLTSLLGAAAGLAGFAILAYLGNGGNDDKKEFKSCRSYGIVLFACMFQMFSIVSWNAIDILTGELFPTCIRSAGMGICTACGRLGAMLAQFVNARLMMAGGDGGTLASASVLTVAAFALLVGAGMPFLLEKDMSQGELRDDVTEEPSTRSISLICMGRGKEQKDHLSDDDTEKDFCLRHQDQNEYQSFQRGAEPFLL